MSLINREITNFLENTGIDLFKEIALEKVNDCKVVIVQDNSSAYSAARQILLDMCKEYPNTNTYINLYQLHKSTIDKNSLYNIIDVGKSYIINLGKFNFIKVSSSNTSEDLKCMSTLSYDVVFYGIKRFTYRKKFLEDVKKCVDSHISKHQISIFENYKFIRNIDAGKSFDDILMNKDSKQFLINNLDVFKKSSEYYKKYNIAHKLGILLYGEPGTGKSSLILAIAKYMMFDIVFLNIQNIIEEDFNTNSRSIYVIEDIDMLIKDRKQNIADVNKAMNKLFQVLDGILAIPKSIFIITTNHIEDLDPALIRSGRFDIKIELSNFDKKMAEDLCVHLGFSKSTLDKLNVTYPLQPSHLQEQLLQYRTEVLVEKQSRKNK